MSKSKVFFVVGHRHWGKSKTPSALTGGRLAHSFFVNSHKFSIRRTSNDDVPVGQSPIGYYGFLKRLEKLRNVDVIATLCPTVWDKKLFGYLRRLKPDYQLFFFILTHRWDGKREISFEEINALKKLGSHWRIYEFKRLAEPMKRANSLRYCSFEGICNARGKYTIRYKFSSLTCPKVPEIYDRGCATPIQDDCKPLNLSHL